MSLYSFSVKSFKYSSSNLSNPVASITNLSIQKNPSKLKHASIVSVNKDGNELDPGNYRPISLLSNMNRIFEKLMYNRINNFNIRHNILCLLYFLFRKHCSTEHALLVIVGIVQNYMEEKFLSSGSLIDLLTLLTKIFCSMNYTITEYVVLSNKWFCSYLTWRF